jgi:hypothetical protein
MPVIALHVQVARIALGTSAGHGFALGSGKALLAYGLISWPTGDVDLFTDQEHGVQTAAGAVEAECAMRALPRSGVTRQLGWPMCSRAWANG